MRRSRRLRVHGATLTTRNLYVFKGYNSASLVGPVETLVETLLQAGGKASRAWERPVDIR